MSPRRLVLVTTLRDPVAYPAEALAALYLQRWGVELHFGERENLCGWTSYAAARRSRHKASLT